MSDLNVESGRIDGSLEAWRWLGHEGEPSAEFSAGYYNALAQQVRFAAHTPARLPQAEAQGPARAATDGLRAALEAIRYGYADQDTSHADFRVRAYELACAALSTGPSASGEAGLRQLVRELREQCVQWQVPTPSALSGWADRIEAAVLDTDASLRKVAAKAIAGFDALVDQSDGVTGLHRNGEIAPWSDLIAGGRYEVWTAEIEDLRTALSTSPTPATEPETHAADALALVRELCLARPGASWIATVADIERLQIERGLRDDFTNGRDLSFDQQRARAEHAADAAVSDAAGEALTTWFLERPDGAWLRKRGVPAASQPVEFTRDPNEAHCYRDRSHAESSRIHGVSDGVWRDLKATEHSFIGADEGGSPATLDGQVQEVRDWIERAISEDLQRNGYLATLDNAVRALAAPRAPATGASSGLTADETALFDSINGDCVLGEQKERELVARIIAARQADTPEPTHDQ